MIAKNKWGGEQNIQTCSAVANLTASTETVTAEAKQSNQRHFIFVALWQWDLWKTFSILDCSVLTWNLLISVSLDTKVIFFKRDGTGAAFID